MLDRRPKVVAGLAPPATTAPYRSQQTNDIPSSTSFVPRRLRLFSLESNRVHARPVHNFAIWITNLVEPKTAH